MPGYTVEGKEGVVQCFLDFFLQSRRATPVHVCAGGQRVTRDAPPSQPHTDNPPALNTNAAARVRSVLHQVANPFLCGHIIIF